jgi:hypothetical protein
LIDLAHFFCLLIYFWLVSADSKKTEHLRALDGANERLHLFKADLLEEGSFDTAIADCVGIFHTASPCFFNATDFQVHLIILQDICTSHIVPVLGS